MSRRIERVNSLLKREISFIVEREMKDPRLGFITITHVECSRDLRHAKVYFNFHTTEDTSVVEIILNRASGYIQGKLGERTRLRYTPKLEFIYDDTLERMERIDRLLKEENG
ncbi:30S ribosome-binding factor RbfA [candidate division WOR-3 bacterium]|nr:30S ribosome-binding factor RbfA [candidate division WOR-3 bacterium]